MTDGAEAGEGTHLDVQEAAVIMQEAGERARHEFRRSHRASFVTWGVLLLLGYGSTWLLVRGQHPFHGINPGAFAAVTLLAAGSALANVAQARSESGVAGLSALRQRIRWLSLIAGLAGMFALEGALAHAGASRTVLGVFEAATPILVAGLFYLTSSALWVDWPVSGLGLWLIAVAAGGAYAGPVGIWAVGALAGGLAFLVMAGVEPWLRRA
ncbi:MAG TPA: hypothetical protein VIK57_03235 [Streptosporangiaceae bacterium]